MWLYSKLFLLPKRYWLWEPINIVWGILAVLFFLPGKYPTQNLLSKKNEIGNSVEKKKWPFHSPTLCVIL